MINLLLSLAAGVAVAAAVLLGSSFGWAAAIVPGAVAAVAAYVLLSRRTFKRLEALFEEAQKEIMAQKFEKAVRTLQGGFVLAPWQFLVRSQIHSQIGVLQYVRQDFDEALPHLERSFSRHWLARAMLATSRYRKRDLDGGMKVFEQAVAANKKEGLLWAAYAWCLEKEGRHEEAIKVLGPAGLDPLRGLGWPLADDGLAGPRASSCSCRSPARTSTPRCVSSPTALPRCEPEASTEAR